MSQVLVGMLIGLTLVWLSGFLFGVGSDRSRIRKEFDRITEVFVESQEAYSRGDLTRFRELRNQHQKLYNAFDEKWGAK